MGRERDVVGVGGRVVDLSDDEVRGRGVVLFGVATGVGG